MPVAMSDPVRSPRVRAAVASDRAALGALAGQLVRFHHDLNASRFMLGENVDQGYGRWLIQEAASDQALVLVAELGDGVAGYVYARQEPRNWNDLIDEHGKIHDVFVDPRFRGRGVARALLTAVCERLRALGCQRLVLATATSNEPARNLFASLGFRSTMIEMMLED